MNSLVEELSAFPGTASVWCGRLTGPPVFEHEPDALHYAASTMKVGVMVAAWQAARQGLVELDAPIPVHNEHASAAPGHPGYGNDQEEDSDDEVWAAIGGERPLRWLVTRMIVRSSNLATNLVLGALGNDFAAVNRVWREAGATRAHTDRGIEDYQARALGISNQVTAHDLAALMRSLAGEPELLDILAQQEVREDFHRGLPEGIRVELKNGWVTGERHSMAMIHPPAAEPYVLAACTTGELADDQACELLGRIAAASYQALGEPR